MFAFLGDIPFPDIDDAPASPPPRREQKRNTAGPPPRKRRRINPDPPPPPPEMNEEQEAKANAEALRQGDIEREAAAGPMPPAYHSLAQINHDLDWKAIDEEDEAKARQIAQDRGWDEQKFMDRDWCVACHLTSTTYKTGVNENDPYNDLCVYADKNYNKVSMRVLVTTAQEMYLEYLSGCSQQNDLSKFWFRKQIYDHIHKHHRTIRVQNEMSLSMNNAIIEHLYETLITIDPITGQTAVNNKGAELILKFQMQNDKIMKNLDSHRSKQMF